MHTCIRTYIQCYYIWMVQLACNYTSLREELHKYLITDTLWLQPKVTESYLHSTFDRERVMAHRVVFKFLLDRLLSLDQFLEDALVQRQLQLNGCSLRQLLGVLLDAQQQQPNLFVLDWNRTTQPDDLWQRHCLTLTSLLYQLLDKRHHHRYCYV